MALTKMLFVMCVVIFSALGAKSNSTDGVPPQPPINPTSAPVTTTVLPTKSTTTGTTSTATTSSTTSITTTTKVPPTTSSPTPITTSTIIPPTSTPKPTPAPTPAPTPVPDPQVGNWTVIYDNSNRSCIIFEAAIQVELLDLKANKTQKINVPVDNKASGSCEESSQYLKITWGQNNSLQLDFVKLNTSKFELGDIKTVLNVTEPAPMVYSLVHDKAEFVTPSENSYKCARVQTLSLTNTDNPNVTVAYLHVSQLQYQAYLNTTERKFDSALDCEGSITSDVVPIVVGCVLAVLVVMVLIAYLVGRRRCQARGYLSM